MLYRRMNALGPSCPDAPDVWHSAIRITGRYWFGTLSEPREDRGERFTGLYVCFSLQSLIIPIRKLQKGTAFQLPRSVEVGRKVKYALSARHFLGRGALLLRSFTAKH
jgi:hypothetical protein